MIIPLSTDSPQLQMCVDYQCKPSVYKLVQINILEIMGFAKTIQIALSKLIDLTISKSDSAFGHACERHDPRRNDILSFLYIQV